MGFRTRLRNGIGLSIPQVDRGDEVDIINDIIPDVVWRGLHCETASYYIVLMGIFMMAGACSCVFLEPTIPPDVVMN